MRRGETGTETEDALRRTLRLVLVVAVFALVAGGAVWWLRRPPSVAVGLANARIALEKGDPLQAVRRTQAVLERDPTSLDALTLLAEAFTRLGNYEQARRTADRALRVKPSAVEPHAWKARAYRLEALAQLQRAPQGAQANEAGRAIRLLDQAVAAANAAPAAPGQTGDLDLQRGLAQLAIADCHRLLESRALDLQTRAAAADRPDDAQKYADEAAKETARFKSAEDQAVASLQSAMNAAGSGAEAGERLQAVFERRGAYDDVIAVYEQLEKAGRTTERAALHAAMALLLRDMREPPLKRSEAVARAKQILARHLGANPGSRDAQIALARLSLMEGNAAAAARLAETVLKNEPHHPQAVALMAQVLLAQKRFEDVKQLIQPISTLYPNWLELQYSLAVAQAETGYASTAQQVYRRLLVLNPQYLPARLRLAESLWKSGRTEAAEKELRDGLTASPSRELILAEVVSLAWQYGTADRAAELIDAALADGEPSPRLLEEAATQYWRIGKVGKAQECLARAGAAGGQSPTAALMRAGRLIEANQPASAETILKGLLDDPKVGVEARIALAGLRYAEGREADGRKLLSEAAAMPAITVSQRFAITEAYLRGRDLDGALESARAVVAIDAQSYTAQLALGEVLLARGDAAGAREAFAAAERLVPPTELGPEQQANLALRRGDYQRCVDVCEAAFRSGAAPPALRLMAADAFERLRRPEAAAEHLTAYVRAEPARLEGYMRLVGLYLRAEKPEDGLKAIEPLVGLQPALARLAEGQILRARGQSIEAVDRLAPALQASGGDLAPDIRREVATTLADWQVGLGQVDEALRTLDWLAQKGDAATAAWGRFNVLVAAARMDAARQELKKIQDLLPSGAITPADFVRLARAQVRVGEPTAAIETARRYAAAFPESDGPVRLEMLIHEQSGNLPEAIRVFDAFARRKREDVDLLSDGVSLYIAAGDFPAAGRVLDQMAGCGLAGALRAGVRRAQLFMQIGLVEAAIAELTKIKTGEPNPPDAVRLTLGGALTAAGRFDESDAELRAVPTHSPRFAEAQRLMADNARKRGRPAGGLPYLDQALQRDPDDVQTVREKVRLYLAADQVRPALQLAERYARRAATPAQHAEWIGALAQLQWLAGDTPAAERNYRAFTAATPRDETARLRFAIFLLAHGRDADAAKLLAERPPGAADTVLWRGLLRLAGGALPAIASAPATASAPSDVLRLPPASLTPLVMAAKGEVEPARQSLRATAPRDLPRADIERVVAAATNEAARGRVRRLAMGRAMLAAGLREVGLSWMRSLAAEWADEPLVWYTLREFLVAMERNTEAEQVAERLRKDHAGSIVGKELLAEKAAGERRHEDAYQILSDALTREGETARLCIRLGDALGSLGKPAEAIARYRRAWELDPTEVSALNNEAYVLANTAGGDRKVLDRALELMRQALTLGPVTPAILETAAWIQVLRGETDQALRALSKVLTDLRSEPIIHYHIGVAYKNAGQLDWARLHLENASLLGAGDLPEKRLARELLSELRARSTTTAPQ